MFKAFKNRRPWIVAVIATVFDPVVAMLYVGKGVLALLYFVLQLAAYVLTLYLWSGGHIGLPMSTVLFATGLVFRLAGAIHGILIVRNRAADEPVKWYAKTFAFVAIALLYFALTQGNKLFFYPTYYMLTDAMYPTLGPHDAFFVSRRAYDGHAPGRGDLVAFGKGLSSINFIKRVVGIPGDRIQMKGGRLFVNGASVGLRRLHADDYVETLPNGRNYEVRYVPHGGLGDSTKVFVVPLGDYFVLGDNRDDSYDSRFALGYVARNDIIGKAEVKYFDGASRRFVFEWIH